jgi:uncharacterized membrane protein
MIRHGIGSVAEAVCTWHSDEASKAPDNLSLQGEAEMQTIAEAIVILAGGMTLGASVIALAIIRQSRGSEGEALIAFLAGLFLGLFGLVVVGRGLLNEGKIGT